MEGALEIYHTEVVIDVGVTRLRDELGMTFGVDARLVDPGVKGGVIDVVDLLALCHVMVEFDGISASPAKGVARVEGFHDLQEFTYVWMSGRVCLSRVHSHSHM